MPPNTGLTMSVLLCTFCAQSANKLIHPIALPVRGTAPIDDIEKGNAFWRDFFTPHKQRETIQRQHKMKLVNTLSIAMTHPTIMVMLESTPECRWALGHVCLNNKARTRACCNLRKNKKRNVLHIEPIWNREGGNPCVQYHSGSVFWLFSFHQRTFELYRKQFWL